MPSEYRLVKQVVDRLANNNDLGEREIAFIVSTGSTAAYYAKEIGLCKNETCYFFSNLNPFKKYSNQSLNEISRVSYLSGPGEASASMNGTIAISRSEFRIIDAKENFLACTIGHELSHILNFDTYKSSFKVPIKGKKLNETHRKELLAHYKREAETTADIDGQEMVLRAGYPITSCIDQMEFLMKTRSVVQPSKLDTHPSFPNRIKTLKDALISQRKKLFKEQTKTKLKWEYHRDLNILKFIPL